MKLVQYRTYRIAHCMECGARFGRDGGAERRSTVSPPSVNGGSASASCSSVSPASESSSSGCVESPLSSSGYSSSDAMPVAVHQIISTKIWWADALLIFKINNSSTRILNKMLQLRERPSYGVSDGDEVSFTLKCSVFLRIKNKK